MDKLVKAITAKTGLDEKMARQVVEVVVTFLKENLPPPLNKNVEQLLSGQITDVSQIAGLGKPGGILGKLFGGKK
jgi:uncharacterized protein (DUF2267 family)